MLIANIILALTTLISLILGLLILISNAKKPVNRALAVFLFGIFIWLLANLLTNVSKNPHTSLLFARTTLIGPSILAYSFLLFCKYYVKQKVSYKKAIFLAILPAILVLTFPTKLNIVSIETYGQKTVTGSIYYLLIFVLLLYFGSGFITLFKYYKKTGNAIEKTQLKYIFAGISLTLIPSIIANAILPSLGYSNAVFYGPSTIILMAIFLSVAIIRHRLLDIRLLVARAVAYVLLLTSLIGSYSLIVYILTNKLFGNSSPITNKIIPIIVAFLLAFSYQSLRKFFNRITKKYFYQDDYEPQVFLDQLNEVLVSTIDLEKLLLKVAKIVEQNIKTTYCVFYLKSSSANQYRFLGDTRHQIDPSEINNIHSMISPISDKVIITDELTDDNVDLNKNLLKNDVALLIRLTFDSKSEKAGIGYVFMGAKKSGSPYNTKDLRTIDIIANELVIAIQNSLRFEEIETFNITLQDKIEHATYQLRKANDRLKALDESKDDFISMASHQLRTPLTSVKGYVSMVLDNDAGKITATQRKLLSQAFVSSQRMVFLIADLLNVSRLKTGKFIIENSPVNLAEIIAGEVKQLTETAEGRHLTLTYNKPSHFPTLMLDETKIRQVAMNFMDNAIYYTPAGGHIEVKVAETDKAIEYSVSDNGLGVPRQDQSHLFTKFYRAANARKARPDGTGLGLFMAKKVIVAQGGAIIFKSQEGRGSTFGFTIPKDALHTKSTN